MKLTVKKVKQLIAACRDMGVQELAFEDFRIQLGGKVEERLPNFKVPSASLPALPKEAAKALQDANALTEWYNQTPPPNVEVR